MNAVDTLQSPTSSQSTRHKFSARNVGIVWNEQVQKIKNKAKIIEIDDKRYG